MASNVRPKQTSKPTAYVCTPSDSLLSESALWNWLIPLWMPNWCSVLKAALSVLVALSLSAWSADRRWPPVPGADPERSSVAIFLKGLQKCLWAIRRKTKNEIYSYFLKVYRRKKGRKEMHFVFGCVWCIQSLDMVFQGCVNIRLWEERRLAVVSGCSRSALKKILVVFHPCSVLPGCLMSLLTRDSIS